MRIAVVTGASSGMGREFAKAIDREYELDCIWVIARRQERLEELASECRTQVRVLPLDLTDRNSFTVLQELFETEKPAIEILVNAAGVGLFGEFTEMDLDGQLEIIELNDKALTAMCHICLPYMK